MSGSQDSGIKTFSVKARNEGECRAKVKKSFGDVEITILKNPPAKPPAFSFKKENWFEYSGYVTNKPDLTKYSSVLAAGRASRAHEKNRPALPDDKAAREAILARYGGKTAEEADLKTDSQAKKNPAANDASALTLSEELVERIVQRLLPKLNNGLMPHDVLPPAASQPTIAKIEKTLLENYFSQSYIKKIKERLCAEFSLAALEDIASCKKAVLNWIAGALSFYDEESEKSAPPRIIALVGPSGCGKTSAIAKIAAAWTSPEKMENADKKRIVGRRKQRVVLLSIDQSIGAEEEIKKYGGVLKIPHQIIYSAEELQKEIMFYSESADIILVDTFGSSPYNAEKIKKLKNMLLSCGQSLQCYIALPAASRDEEFAEIIKRFEMPAFKSLVLTKLDEARNIGGIISYLIEQNISVSFLTMGQSPLLNDIERATAERLLEKIHGLQNK